MIVKSALFVLMPSLAAPDLAHAEAHRMARHELWVAPLSQTFGEVFRPPAHIPGSPNSIEDIFRCIWRSGLPVEAVLPQLFSLWSSAPTADAPPRWGGRGVEHWARFHLARHGLVPEMTHEEIRNWLAGRSPWLTRSALPIEYFFGRSVDELPRFRPSDMARVITPHVTLESVIHMLTHLPKAERSLRARQRVRALFDREYQHWLNFLGDWSQTSTPELYGRKIEANELSFLWHADLRAFVSSGQSPDVAKARTMGIETVADFANWLSQKQESNIFVRRHDFSDEAWSEWWRPLRFLGITSSPTRETIAIFTQRFPSCQDQMKNASH